MARITVMQRDWEDVQEAKDGKKTLSGRTDRSREADMKQKRAQNTAKSLGRIVALCTGLYPLEVHYGQEMPAQTRRNLWALLIFLLVSIMVLQVRHVQIFDLFPAAMHPLLGAPPPLPLVTTALFVYVFATLVLVAYRLLGGQPPVWKNRDLALRLVFYLLYLAAGGLDGYFHGVLTAGLLLFALEQFHGWSFILEDRIRRPALPSPWEA
jgi:hypothetical protein